MGYAKSLTAHIGMGSVSYDYLDKSVVLRGVVTDGLKAVVGRGVEMRVEPATLVYALRFAEECQTGRHLGQSIGYYPRVHQYERAEWADDCVITEPCAICGHDPDYKYHEQAES